MDAPFELERLYYEHAQALFAFLVNFTRNEADTHDLLQELFVRISRQPGLLQNVSEPRGFLLRMAHNAAIDLIRRRGARQKSYDRLAEETIPIFASADNRDENAFREAVSRALDELVPEQRAVVHLKLWEGFTFERIAEVLGIPLNTAASRYRYGLDKMRQRLRPLYNEIK
jgi:RNA polymerase sigma-70 factor (ECF subfamily)